MPTGSSWYHAHQAEIRRSDGQSAVGLASYITGESLKNETTGLWCSRNHPGDVVDWFSVAPAGAPAFFTDNAQLSKAWNAIEASETRINSQPAIHWNVGGSREFSKEDHHAVAKAIAQKMSDRYGVVVVAGIHEPTGHGHKDNWHYHFGHNMRCVDAHGIGAKVREPIAKATRGAETVAIREMIADVLNARLELIGSNERVSHLSYKERGIEKEPMRHLGNKAKQLELKGVVTEIGDWNRAVQARNAEREREKQESEGVIKRLEAEIVDLKAERDRRKKPMALDDLEYKQAEQLKRDVFGKGEDLGKERGNIAERLKGDEEFLRRFEKDRDAGELKRQEELNRRTGDPEIENPRLRYLQSLANASGRTTFDVLTNAAKDEAAKVAQQHDERTKQAAQAKDPDDKHIILILRDINHAGYMARVEGELENISRHNEGIIPNRRLELDENGNRVPTQSERRAEAKEYWMKQGDLLRDELEVRRELKEERAMDRLSTTLEQQTINAERGIDAAHQGANRYRYMDEQHRRATDDGHDDDPPKSGRWRAAEKGEVFEPGRHFQMNQTTGTREVWEGAGERPQQDNRDIQREAGSTRTVGVDRANEESRETDLQRKAEGIEATRQEHRENYGRSQAEGQSRENEDVGGPAVQQQARSRGGRSL